MPAAFTLIIEQQADWSRGFQWLDSNKNPIDLTGYTADLTISLPYDFSTVIVDLSTSNGKLAMNQPLGYILASLANSLTANLTPGVYHHSLTVTDTHSVPTEILEGNCIISEAIKAS